MSFSSEIARQKYSFVASVKDAAISSLYMLAFVTLFYILISCLRDALGESPLCTLFIVWIEVTGAVLHITSSSALSLLTSIALCGFSLGFGGLSVVAQVGSVTGEADLRISGYVIIKVAQGLLSALTATLLGAIYLSIL